MMYLYISNNGYTSITKIADELTFNLTNRITYYLPFDMFIDCGDHIEARNVSDRNAIAYKEAIDLFLNENPGIEIYWERY